MEAIRNVRSILGTGTPRPTDEDIAIERDVGTIRSLSRCGGVPRQEMEVKEKKVAGYRKLHSIGVSTSSINSKCLRDD